MRDHHDVDEGDVDIGGLEMLIHRSEAPNACGHLDVNEGDVDIVFIEITFRRVGAP